MPTIDSVAVCRATAARMRLLQMHFESGVGHIGGNLSCLDILLAIYHDVLTEFDHFVLSGSSRNLVGGVDFCCDFDF